MNIHENARTTPASRALLVIRVRQQGWSVPEATRSDGISRRTAYKWLKRFELKGQAELHHQRTRPYTPRTNGKAERSIQTMLREWAYGRRYRTSHERGKPLTSWLR